MAVKVRGLALDCKGEKVHLALERRQQQRRLVKKSEGKGRAQSGQGHHEKEKGRGVVKAKK